MAAAVNAVLAALVVALYREPFSPDELREAKIKMLEDEIETSAFTICKKAQIPMAPWGAGYVLLTEACWCADPHRYATDGRCVDHERMQLVNHDVICPLHGARFGTRSQLDLAPGKRKSSKTRDALINQINLHPKLTRAYGFWGGSNLERAAIGVDPVAALHEVSPSPRSLLQGVVIEAPSLRRCREIFETKAPELPKRDLHGLLRDDLSLPADWHGAELTVAEQTRLETQRWEDARAQRAARQKAIDKLRREAERLTIEPI